MPPKKFSITIEETVSDVFYVYAEDSKTAIELARGKYESGEFMLAPGNLISMQMAITEPTETSIRWTEI